MQTWLRGDETQRAAEGASICSKHPNRHFFRKDISRRGAVAAQSNTLDVMPESAYVPPSVAPKRNTSAASEHLSPTRSLCRGEVCNDVLLSTMTAAAFNEVIRKTGWICLGACCLMTVVVLLNDTRFGVAALLLSFVNAASFYFLVFRVRATPGAMSVRTCLSSLCYSLLAMSVAIGLIVAFALAEHRSFSAKSASWVTVVVCAIAVHQAFRGSASVRRRWKSADDIRRSLAASRLVDPAREFSRKYDLVFFMLVSLLASLTGRAFGQPTTLFVGAILLGLSLPYAVSASVTGIALAARLLPPDEPMIGDDWNRG